MGHRIELGEIETAAVGMDGLEKCCCVYDEKRSKIILYTQLEQVREVIFKIIQNRDLSIDMRMAYIMDMARKLQESVDVQEVYRMEDIAEELHISEKAAYNKRDKIIKEIIKFKMI